MNEIIVEATGLPLRFPDPREEAYARAQEFRRLSSDGRWQEIAAIMAWGLNQVRTSPWRALIEQRWEAQENEWRKLQLDLLAQQGK